MHELPPDFEKELWRYSLRRSYDDSDQPQPNDRDYRSADTSRTDNTENGLFDISVFSHFQHLQGQAFPFTIMSASETDPLLPKRPTSFKRNSSSAGNDQTNGHLAYRPDEGNSMPSGNESDNSDTEGSDTVRDSAPLSTEAFYELIGMKVPDPHGKTPSSLEAAHGFYGQVCKEKRLVEKKYRLYDLVTIFFLIVQILLSAVFIVLGALNVDQHVAIAVLGAVSSVIGGTLALMRGNGLPNRLRMERDGLKAVILEADELYWDVGAGRSVTYGDVKKLRDAYSTVLEDARKNHPDTWNATAVAVSQGLTKTSHIRRV